MPTAATAAVQLGDSHPARLPNRRQRQLACRNQLQLTSISHSWALPVSVSWQSTQQSEVLNHRALPRAAVWLTCVAFVPVSHSVPSGKGTFASRLAPLFGIPTISTGDLIRAEIKAGSAIGAEVKALTERGGLVSDSIVLSLLSRRLSEPDAARGFILDGYPRRVSQAETLSTLAPLGLAVNLILNEKILVEKALARRVCPHCGSGYNLANIVRDGYMMPPLLPKIAGLCDKCPPTQGKLITRADDTEVIIRERLKIYQEETFPIIDFYRSKGLLLEFEVRKGVADLPELAQLIQKRLGIDDTGKKQ